MQKKTVNPRPQEGLMATAHSKQLRATTILYQGFWQNKGKESAILLSLNHLADTLGPTLNQAQIQSHTAVLAEQTQQQIVQAFARATEECKFFPAPALLRDFSGLGVSGDPITREAKEKLFYEIGGCVVLMDPP